MRDEVDIYDNREGPWDLGGRRLRNVAIAVEQRLLCLRLS
jgi:hypothetical protein